MPKYHTFDVQHYRYRRHCHVIEHARSASIWHTLAISAARSHKLKMLSFEGALAAEEFARSAACRGAQTCGACRDAGKNPGFAFDPWFVVLRLLQDDKTCARVII
jgi:hypothetical protein